ncbi:MAG: ABC transporter ATP-binding protein [Geminicoccaceae bacterium]|nr:ABC transporter ATP-binding protein [Geminicoccaceae bacterium]
MTLRLEGVALREGRDVFLEGIDLDLDDGRLYVLLGPTLAGKTSLLRVMAGLDRPTRGRLLADGKDVTGASVRRRNVAMVYQQFINYPSFTVRDNIASPLRIKGMDKSEIESRVLAAARRVQIEPLLDRLPAELSGGQQQRCAIARALVKDAGLLLLDEPLVNLDYKLREELREELRGLFQGGRTTVVYATTEPHEALVMGGETILMDEGRVVQRGPTTAVFHRPNSVRAARVFSDPPMNLVPVTVEGGVARGAGGFALPLTGHLARLGRGNATLGVRANHLFLRPTAPDGVPFTGTVEVAEISGSETFIHLGRGGLHLVVQEEGVHERPSGAEVTVHADPARFFAFDAQGKLAAAPGRAALLGEA